MGFLFFLFVLVGWAYLYSRLRRAEDRLNQDQYERERDSEVIAELTRRVWALEKSRPAPPPIPVSHAGPDHRCRRPSYSTRHRLLFRRLSIRPRSQRPRPLPVFAASEVFSRTRAASTNLARPTPRFHGRPGMGSRGRRKLAQQARRAGAGDRHRAAAGLRIHPRRSRSAASPSEWPSALRC